MKSLRSYVLAMALAVVLPGAAFGAATMWWIATELQQDNEESAARTADAIAADVSNYVQMLTSAMGVLSRSPSIAAGDLETAYRHAAQLAADLGHHVGLATPQGEQIWNTRRPLGDKLPRRSDPVSYTRALETGRVSISDVIIGAVTQYPLVTIDLPASGPQGQLVLATSTDTARIGRVIARTKLSDGWISAVVDSRGMFIARSVDQSQWAGKQASEEVTAAAASDQDSGSFRNRTREGVEAVTFFKRVPGTGWTVIVGMPAGLLSQQVRVPVAILAGGAVTALALTLALALAMGRRLGKAKREITEVVGALGREQVPCVTGSFAEVTEIVAAARRAAEQLGDRTRALEQEIAERKLSEERASESERRYRGLVESQTDLVVRFDPLGQFTFVNEKVSEVFGEPVHALLGRPWDDFVHPDDVEAARAVILEAVRSPNWRARVEIRIRTTDGYHWFQWEGVAIFDPTGAFSEFQAAGRDIDDQRATQTALQRAKRDAERASEAKSRFLAAASHDLRQPFQAMMLYHEVLKLRLVDEHTRKLVDGLGSAMAAGQELLSALLDLSTLEAGTSAVNTARVSIDTVLDPLAAQFTDLAWQKHLRFRYVRSTAEVVTDQVLLARMVRNLLVNALKYTPDGSVLLGCRCRGGEVRIEVWDTGPGIPPDKHEVIFEEFTQLHNAERDRAQGLGLGLAIVAKTGRLLGHPVSVRSTLGKGTVFCVSVPRSGTGGWERTSPMVNEALLGRRPA